MSNIKLKNEIGIEQIYTGITKIKLPLEDGTYKTFYEGEPAVIVSEFSDPIKLEGQYTGYKLEVTEGETIDLRTELTLNKRIPLSISTNISPFTPVGNCQITNTGIIDVTNFATAQISDPNLIPENIKEGVTIFGVTGIAKPLDTTDEVASSLQARIKNTNSLDYLFNNSTISNFDFIHNLDFSTISSINYLFYNCKNIIELCLPPFNNISSLDYFCSGCTSLKVVKNLQPSNSSSVYMDYAFSNCINLETIENCDFHNCYSAVGLFENCRNLKDLPPLMLFEAYKLDYAFRNCSNLKSLVIADWPNAIYSYPSCQGLFEGCTSLEKLTLPGFCNSFSGSETATSVFKDCFNLKEIIFTNVNSELTKVSSSNVATLLSNCYHFNGTVDPIYNPEGLRDGVIRVPFESVNTLRQSSGWASFASQIKSLDNTTVQSIPDITVLANKKSIYQEALLLDFKTAPKVTIISHDERLLKIKKIVVTESKLRFRVDLTGKLGHTRITIKVADDQTTLESSFNVTIIPNEDFWSVEPVPAAKYGFELNSKGYYESTNKEEGSEQSAALCKLVINNTFDTAINFNLECISYGDNLSDYGLLSQLDSTLSTDYNKDYAINSSAAAQKIYKSFETYSFSAQDIYKVPTKISYIVPPGEHFIYLKYRKTYTGANSDSSLKFKIIYD